VGGNRDAAIASGIDADKLIRQVYIISGVIATFAGWMYVGRIASANAMMGQGMIFEVQAAAVIGGISLSGGEGSPLGVIVGAALMGVLKNAFVLLAVPGYWQTVVIGVVIIGAVSIDSLRRKRAG